MTDANFQRNVGSCRSCRAPVYWGVSKATGRRMPLDVEPSDQGNCQITEEGIVVYGAADAATAREAGVVLRVSHFVTCPQRETWRH